MPPIQCRVAVIASIVSLLLSINWAVYIFNWQEQRQRGREERRTIWHPHWIRIHNLIAQFKSPNTLNRSAQNSLWQMFKRSLANANLIITERKRKNSRSNNRKTNQNICLSTSRLSSLPFRSSARAPAHICLHILLSFWQRASSFFKCLLQFLCYTNLFTSRTFCVTVL